MVVQRLKKEKGKKTTISLLLLLFLYLNSVKILKYITFTYKFKLIKGKAWLLQYEPALCTPNLKND